MMTIFQENLMPSDAAVLFAAFSWASSRWGENYRIYDDDDDGSLASSISTQWEYKSLTVCLGDGGCSHHNRAHKLLHTFRVNLLNSLNSLIIRSLSRFDKISDGCFGEFRCRVGGQRQMSLLVAKESRYFCGMKHILPCACSAGGPGLASETTSTHFRGKHKASFSFICQKSKKNL